MGDNIGFEMEADNNEVDLAIDNEIDLELTLCRDIDCNSNCASDCCMPCIPRAQVDKVYVCHVCRDKIVNDYFETFESFETFDKKTI